jgi:hypothetical protein
MDLNGVGEGEGGLMAFIQTIDFRTTRFEEGKPYIDEYLAKTEGRRTVRRTILCQDRDDAEHYINIAFFDSYDSAMENSNLPETAELAAKLALLSDGPDTFHNFEVIVDDSY